MLAAVLLGRCARIITLAIVIKQDPGGSASRAVRCASTHASRMRRCYGTDSQARCTAQVVLAHSFVPKNVAACRVNLHEVCLEHPRVEALRLEHDRLTILSCVADEGFNMNNSIVRLP